MSHDLIINGRNWSRDGLPGACMSGTAVVVGDGPRDDNFALRESFHAVYAVNRAIFREPSADFIVTFHPDDARDWRHRSARRNGPQPEIVSICEPADDVVEYRGDFGSSGLLGLVAALEHGWRRVVLVGMPLDGIYQANLPVWGGVSRPVRALYPGGWWPHRTAVFSADAGVAEAMS